MRTILRLLPGALLAVPLLAVPATAAIGGQANVHHRVVKDPSLRPSETGFYVVEFVEPPLAVYGGGIPGLEATNPAARGEAKLDARSPASRAYLAFLEERQAAHLATVERALDRRLEILYRYRAAGNGVALRMDAAEAVVVAGLEGVLRVTPDRLLPLHTDRGPIWIGAGGIWDGSDTGGLGAFEGEGTIVGVIDSGVNMDHDSFSDSPVDGHTYVNPFGTGVFVGWCDPTNPNHDPSYVCNDKLVGAWDYTDAYCAANPGTCSEDDGPEDGDGHGSHTASTAAGNVLDTSGDLARDLSGVAPHANLITYDACYVDELSGQGLCPFTATSAGADQAVLDGVDAINYSIGGGGDPWGGDINSFFLNNVAAGTFVSASAGNSGPAAGTTSHRGPWVITVGASTHDRLTVENELIDMSGGIGPPADMTGASRTGGYGPDSVVYAGDFDNGDVDPEQCLSPFPGGTWTAGEIVLCDRGTIARVLKCAHVAAGGAAGCILANANAGQTPPVPDAHVIPAIHVDLADGDALRSWLASGAGHTGTLTAGTLIIDPGVADVMASFSSRGPNEDFSTLKPDVTNPGVSIFAAVATDGVLPPPELGTLSGTSMSSPHTAGSGALLRSVHPTWTPSELKSALMMSSDTTVLKEDGVTASDPFDRGAGRVDLSKAARVSVVMDETAANYLAEDPAMGGRPENLNVPSLQQNACVITCTWPRTFSSVASGSVGWTISFTTPVGLSMSASPSAFTLPAGADQMVDFSADVSGLPLGTWTFAEATLTPDDGSPVLHLPVAVRAATQNFPALVEFLTTSNNSSGLVQGLQSSDEITALTTEVFGLSPGTQTDVSLNEDPTNGDPYDDLGQVFVKTVSVPVGAKRLVAITDSDEAPDVDLYVGTGMTPSAGTEVCSSTTPEADERCEITDPSSGSWWILVQNWQGSGNQPDLIQLVDARVPGTDNGNMTVTGPASVPAGDSFDLTVSWNAGGLDEGEIFFGAFSVAPDGGSPPIGTIAVDIERQVVTIFADGFESGDTSAWSGSVP